MKNSKYALISIPFVKLFNKENTYIRFDIAFIILVVLIIFVFPKQVNGFDNVENSFSLDDQLELYDFSEIESSISSTENGDKLSIRTLVEKAIKGDLNISFKGIVTYMGKTFFNELYENSALLKNLIVVAILSSVLKNLTDSFKHKEIAELGFYISYVVVIIILFNSFRLSVGIMVDVVTDVSNVMLTIIPIITSLLLASGNQVSAFTFNPVLFITVNVITRLIKYILSPILTMVAVIQTVNYLSVRDMLTKLSEQLRDAMAFLLKTVGVIFVTILSLQRISTPIINNFFAKTAKISVGAIPVVGEVLSGAVDTVIYWTTATKNGFMVGAVIVLILISAVPVIKLVVMIFIYKFTASIMQPISDERIIDCIDDMGSLTILILGATFMVLVMFIFNIMITLSI